MESRTRARHESKDVDNDVEAMLAESPFAHLVSEGRNGLIATPLPLILERDPGGICRLVGHFSSSNPHTKELERSPEALAIFVGPHGYVPPSWFTDRTQAPTWNYAIAYISVCVAIDRSRAAASQAVRKLTERMESGRVDAWSVGELGGRLDRLLPDVIGFKAEITSVYGKFKLGQRERKDTQSEAIDGVCKEGNLALARAMFCAKP